MTRRLAATLVALLALLATLSPIGDAAESDDSASGPGITLDIDGPRTVALGEPIHARLSLDGDKLDGKIKSSLSIEPSDGSQLPIPVKLVEEIVFPGDVLERSYRIDTGRFIAEPGTWVIRFADAKPISVKVTAPKSGTPRFVDITERSGLDSPDWTDANPVNCTPSSLGSAWGDFDGDGDLDLYITRYRGGGVLYRNDKGHFVDVTEHAGMTPRGFPETMATFVDFDSDGDQDLHVVGDGGSALWRNDGSGSFTDVADKLGVDVKSAGTEASWADVDRDGDLDVMVAAYGQCSDSEDQLLDDAPRRDALLLQDEDGTFSNHTDLLGISEQDDGLGFGTLWLDVDGDSDLDLIVVNDDNRFIQQRGGNHLWINKLDEGKGLRFEEQGKARGAGDRRNAMGIAPIDHDRDGDIDLGVSDMGPSQLLENDGTGHFKDIAQDVGADRGFQDGRTPSTTWGLVPVDIDNDGDDDFAVPAGALGTTDDYFGGAEPVRSFGRMNLAAPNSNSLLLSDKGKRYVDVGAASGLQRYGLWRSVAIADTDDDGRVDLLFTRLAGPPMYVRNETAKTGHWLALRLQSKGAKDACGAMVKAGGRAFLHACGGVGLGAGHDPRVHVGLGKDTGDQQVKVTWPDGAKEAFRIEGVDRTVDIKQGQGDVTVKAPHLKSDPASGGDDSLSPWWLLLLAIPIALVLLRGMRRSRTGTDAGDE